MKDRWNITDWKTLEDESFSDHKVITFSLEHHSNEEVTMKKRTLRKWHLEKTDWEKYQDTTETKLNAIGSLNMECEEDQRRSLVGIIHESMDESSKRFGEKRTRIRPY